MITEKKASVRSSSRGFTLIETAIVLALSSFLLAGSMVLLKSWMKQASAMVDGQRLNEIQEALANFEKQNNRLPCAALLNAAPGTLAFGRERIPCTAGGGGTFLRAGRSGAAGPPGTIPMPASNSAIVIGALPVRDLGLPDSYLTNGYGYAYTYAVTQSETAVNSLNGFGGAINVVDAGGNSILPLASDGSIGTALYVVVDHGKDGKGTYTRNGALTPTACSSVAGKDIDNCNHYAFGHFRSMPFGSQPGANWFDDLAVYDTGMATSSSTCLQPIVSSNTGTAVPQITPVVPGTSGGWTAYGYDSGFGWSLINVGPFVFYYWNTFSYGAGKTGFSSVSPTAAAYCPDARYHVVTGGCRQTNGVTTYGRDLSAIPDNQQVIFPALGHPAMLNNVGAQGWECNGSSVLGMRPQAYVVCCTGG